MSTAEARAVEQAVDTDRYPLTGPESAEWKSVVSRTRHELRSSGCSILPDFIRPAHQDALRRECAEIAPDAHYDVETVNAYNIDIRTPLPEDHPGRLTTRRGNAFVARDRVPAAAIIHQLYTSELFKRFIADCFELPVLHELGDPLSGLVLNVVRPGMEHPWHFDTNEFTVSMLTQEAEDGGVFEYCPNIRSARDENFRDVRAVLTGSGEHLVRRLTLRPGDLQLFKGRYALHRVSTVKGTRARHTAIFAYSERPGVIGSVARTKQLFGRVLPEHIEAEKKAVRVDQLLD
ncbi:HalD/BesD family halogenase [Streptomyces specialis]|uniref:HalD/BesD family halogenase n=1 Tax=Streptomyces specialis TaxID=498367 RepID=UPI00073E936A|nr:arpA protein [Streptomyces specialis]